MRESGLAYAAFSTEIPNRNRRSAQNERHQRITRQCDRKVISTIEQKLIEGQAVEAIRACYDPEIPVNIYDLGLIYDVTVNETG